MIYHLQRDIKRCNLVLILLSASFLNNLILYKSRYSSKQKINQLKTELDDI